MSPVDDFDDSSVQPVVRRRRREAVEPAASEPVSPDSPGTREPVAPEPVAPEPVAPEPVAPEPVAPEPVAAEVLTEQPAADPADVSFPDEEYVELPPRIRGGRRVLGVIGVVLMLAAIGIGLVFVQVSRQIDPAGEPGEPIESLVIPAGSSTDSIATILDQQQVISSARLFRYYVRWQGDGPWDAGEYVDFRRGSSFDEAIEVLDAGPVPVQASVVRITEGARLLDALARISEQLPWLSTEQLQASLESGEVTSKYKPVEVTSWEGLLFPDTYEFDEGATAQQVLQTMATRMEEVLDDLGYDKAEALQGRSAYELITIASLIEKETGAPAEERGMISRVISNRLDEGEPLGIDAAVLYGLNRSSGELTKADLKVQSPYNTRIVDGLPPTPISMPGRASLAAAIQPAEGNWRYYVLVSNDPPTHFFTDDYDEFLEAKSDAQANGVF